MEELYEKIGLWDDQTRVKVWERWVWGSDCNAPPMEQCCDMNEMHILGILCSINETENPVDQFNHTLAEIIPDLTIIHLHPKPISKLSLRELIDQLECMQLNWGQVLDAADDKGDCLLLIRACMARLGQIVHNAFPTDGIVLDDPQHTSPLPQQISTNSNNNDDGTSLSIISRKSLRQAICTCLSLARVQDIYEKSVLIPESTQDELKNMIKAMRQHHMEASMDMFNLLQQMAYLAPGMRLVYRTNFAGMYNDVSQVIYFHYPRFCRLPQIPLKEVSASQMHMLPLISQLIPDIPVVYEDDSKVFGLTVDEVAADSSIMWAWLVCCGEVFLIDVAAKIIFESRDHSLASLVVYFLKQNKRKIGDDASNEDGIFNRCENFTAHCHLEMI